MTRQHFLLILGAVVLAASALALLLLFRPMVRETPPVIAVQSPSRQPGMLRYPQGAPQLAEIVSAPAELAPLPITTALDARIAYDESVTARVSSPVPGRVVALPVDLGERVKAGQTLLTIDSPELGTALADAEKAHADSRHKELAWQRAQSLYEGEVLARKDLESAENDWRQARAEEKRTQLRLANLHVRQGFGPHGESFALAAPIAGVVTERNVNPGLEVRPDLAAPLFVISDPSRLWAIVDLPEGLLGQIHPGQSVALETPVLANRAFLGRVERVAPALDPATRRIPVRIAVPNPEGLLRPEMFVRVRLLGERDQVRQVLRVPAAAVITEGVTRAVFIEQAPGEFVKRRVEVALQDRDYVYLAAGVAGGERVVQAGALLLASELTSGE